MAERIEREKVIKGLECLAQMNEPMANPCSKCGYHDRPNFAFCVRDIASDALALLKEQEPKSVLHKEEKKTRTPRMCITCRHYDQSYHCALKDEYIGYLYCDEPTTCRAWKLSDDYKEKEKENDR